MVNANCKRTFDALETRAFTLCAVIAYCGASFIHVHPYLLHCTRILLGNFDEANEAVPGGVPRVVILVSSSSRESKASIVILFPCQFELTCMYAYV